jgi:hypothetical protein
MVTGTDPTATADWAPTRRPVRRPAGVDTIDIQGRTQPAAQAEELDAHIPALAPRPDEQHGALRRRRGYTLVTADDLDAAVALARGCPFLQHDGGVEVGELTLLNRGTRQLGDNPA